MKKWWIEEDVKTVDLGLEGSQRRVERQMKKKKKSPKIVKVVKNKRRRLTFKADEFIIFRGVQKINRQLKTQSNIKVNEHLLGVRLIGRLMEIC